ncbi:MAG: Acyl-CoA dehydrogenase type 2 domain protein [Microbacterium sp.]|nr:Acyl-CoA dehydrogenase type 2 domain protein [Microbacterium sp.]
MTTTAPNTAPATAYDALLERFGPIFARIKEGAVKRETARSLPLEQVGWLRDAGFGAVRVPLEHGGSGASAVDLFRLLIELARADSNVAHIWRGHFAFLEVRLTRPDPECRRFWSERAVEGVVVGNAQSESGTSTFTESKTVLTDADDGRLVLTGEKYYSTGTIFSTWSNVTARYGDDHVSIAVPLDAPGITVVDDWDGFGQRLTGTGTTVFRDVTVERAHVSVHRPEDRQLTYTGGFYQLFLLAVLAGIARAAVDDAGDYVRGRVRPPLGTRIAAQDDPLAQSVLGRASGAAYAAEATVLRAAEAIDRAYDAKLAQVGSPEIYTEADASAYRAQVAVIPIVLSVVTDVFDVGGASSTARSRGLDRHWRNARTIASHNPVKARERAIGELELHGTLPDPFGATPEASASTDAAEAAEAGEPPEAPAADDAAPPTRRQDA